MWAILRGRALQVRHTIHASWHMRRGSTPGKKGTRVPIGVLDRKDARRALRAAKSQAAKVCLLHARLHVNARNALMVRRPRRGQIMARS